MTLCFVDSSPIRFGPQTLHSEAMGGAVTTLLLLTEALAQQGQQLEVVARRSERFQDHETEHLGQGQRIWRQRELWQPQSVDALVWSGTPESLAEADLASDIPTWFWCHNYHPDYPICVLANLVQAQRLQGILFVSHWQAQVYQALAKQQGCVLDAAACHVMPHAHNPMFNSAATSPQALLAKKSTQLRLVYTSVPGRGLGVLLSIWPALRQRFPELQLDVFSSLAVYQATAQDQAYAALFQEMQNLDGVHTHGAVPLPVLAEAMQQAHILAYPSLGKEAAGLVVLEAQAAGLQVVCSDYGALPEYLNDPIHLACLAEPRKAFPFLYFERLSQALWNWQQQPLHMAQACLNSAQQQQAQRWAARAVDWLNLLGA